MIALTSLLTALSATADGSDMFAWSPTRALSWQDFSGAVPRTGDDKRVAATTASISWSYKFTVAQSGSTCIFTITAVSSVANFHPESSWVRPGHRNPGVLEHEQGHFDIAQIYSEKFEAVTRKFLDYRGDCQGRSKRQATEYSEREIARLLNPVYEDIWNQYRSRQETYDLETQHGSKPAEQALWTRSIATMLKR